MTESNKYKVLLFYKYVQIDNPEEFTAEHLAFCKALGLKGRIHIAEEGINGTVSGTVEQTNLYMDGIRQDERFSDLMFKIDDSETHAFKKMHVRVKKEIVSLHLQDDVNPNEVTGNRLKPNQFYQQMNQEDTIVIDARNDYEYELGHFKGAIKPDIKVFRDLPDWIRENKQMLAGKRILTYCTGGIRCEKFSGWLLQEGFDDVSQLDGGIVTYGKDPEVKGQDWQGKCYVFDERISVPVNQVESIIVGQDYFSGEPCERYVNCANPECNKQILCSEENEHRYLRGCSHQCRIHPRNLYVKEHGLTQSDVEERLSLLIEGY